LVQTTVSSTEHYAGREIIESVMTIGHNALDRIWDRGGQTKAVRYPNYLETAKPRFKSSTWAERRLPA
jgi:hypothetical protein